MERRETFHPEGWNGPVACRWGAVFRLGASPLAAKEARRRGGDCQEEFEEMQEAAWEAVGMTAVAAIAVTLGGPTNPVFIGPELLAANSTIGAVVKLGSWAACKLL